MNKKAYLVATLLLACLDVGISVLRLQKAAERLEAAKKAK